MLSVPLDAAEIELDESDITDVLLDSGSELLVPEVSEELIL